MFLSKIGVARKRTGGPFGGFSPTADFPVTRQAIALSLRFCVSFPSEGNYYRSAAIPEPGEPETASQVRRVADRFGRCLMGHAYLTRLSKDDVGLHRSG